MLYLICKLQYIRSPTSSLKRVNLLLPFFFVDFGQSLIGPGKMPFKATGEIITFASIFSNNRIILKGCHVRYRSQLIRTKPNVTRTHSTESEDYPLDYRSYIRMEKFKMREVFSVLFEIIEEESEK